MQDLEMGGYRARLANSDADLAAALALRSRCFRCSDPGASDRDQFDEACQHVLIEALNDQRLVGCFRLLPLTGEMATKRSYSAQFYELSVLKTFAAPILEMGRFCIDPELNDPDILRLAWAAMARYVDEGKVEFMFGCTSFSGVKALDYLDAFQLLQQKHLAPKRWLPKIKAPSVFAFAKGSGRRPNYQNALAKMPPLLRSYLAMGGRVSDHAVIDRDLDRLHVFTGLEINAISPLRKRQLRAIAG